MKVSADVLYGLLSEKYELDRFGRGIKPRELCLPIIYELGSPMEPGGVYVGRTGDLPDRLPDDSVFICCGIKPPRLWTTRRCEIFYASDAHDDLIGLFNSVQRIIGRLISWENRMRQLSSRGAHVRELVEESIPLFEGRITVTDYELRVLAYCELDEDHPELGVQMSSKYDFVPTEKMSFVSSNRRGAVRNREPFFVEEPGKPDSYCINLFLGDNCIGTCSLMPERRALRPLDLELFQEFSCFVRDALAIQARSTGNQIVTARTLFDQLLRGFPVSKSDMDHALNLVAINMDDKVADCKWCCVVMRNTHRGKNLPEKYLCSTLEGILPNATALLFEDSIVAFCLLHAEEHRADEICDPLQAYLEDMEFEAGVSRAYRDPFHAQRFYRQAVCALETTVEDDGGKRWHLFDDCVVDYMMQNCCGDFDPEMIVPPDLVRLHHYGTIGSEYVETLRQYLDNDCNASKTSKVMFLHRSTLVQRLDKIREIVDFESPGRCLYLRMCLHLPDIDRALERGAFL